MQGVGGCEASVEKTKDVCFESISITKTLLNICNMDVNSSITLAIQLDFIVTDDVRISREILGVSLSN